MSLYRYQPDEHSSTLTTIASEARPTAARQVGTVALAVAAAHGANDVYSAFLHPLLPRLMGRFELSVALAATLTMTLSLAASVLQPFMGHLADRYGARWFVVLGPVTSGVFLSLIGWAPSFAILMALLVLGGIGSAAFHPPAASMTANAGGTDRGGGMRLSVFAFGGAIGYASGPLIAVGIVSAWGLRQLWVAMIPILLFAPLLLRALPRGSPQRVEHAAPVAIVPLLRGPLGLVFLISTIAAFVHRTFMTMQPIALAEAGRPESTGAFVLSLYLASEAVGSLTGGVLVSRVSRQQLLLALTALSLPAHIGAVALPAGSPGALASTMVAGFLNMAVLPPIVLTAQQLVPGRAAASSGIVMGLAWATGSIGVFGAGALGDVVGPRSAALFCFPVLLLAMAAALHPSLGRLGRQPG